jgi:hypothetical protein
MFPGYEDAISTIRYSGFSAYLSTSSEIGLKPWNNEFRCKGILMRQNYIYEYFKWWIIYKKYN